MKKVLFVAAIALCAMGCCKKCDKKCEGNCENKCCQEVVADSAVVCDSAAVVEEVVEVVAE